MIAVITSMAPHGYVVAFDDANLSRTSGASGCTHVASGQSNRASQGRALERSVVVQLEDRLSDDMHSFVKLIACLLSRTAAKSMRTQTTLATDEPPAFARRFFCFPASLDMMI